MVENCNKPEKCIRCGSDMGPVVDRSDGWINPDYLQCEHCGLLWHRQSGCWDPATKEAQLQRKAERENQRPVKPHPLQPVADYLGYSLRQTYTHAITKPGIIGITYDRYSSQLLIRIEGEALISTLPAGVHVYPLPVGTAYVHAGVYSGPVSGIVGHYHHLDKAYPKIKVPVPSNCSGVNYGYIPFNSSGEIIPPPTVV